MVASVERQTNEAQYGNHRDSDERLGARNLAISS